MQYLEFDENTGSISGITNSPSADKLNIPIQKDLAVKFIDGVEQLSEWRVLPDLQSSTKYKIIKVVKSIDEDFSNPNIFPLDKQNKLSKQKNIFQIVQKKGQWYGYANTDEHTKNFYMENNSYFGKEKVFYVTAENDKRYYIGNFKIEFEKFFSNEIFPLTFSCNESCDIYTTSRNSEFLHVSQL